MKSILISFLLLLSNKIFAVEFLYITENLPPYSYYDKHKNLVGFSCDILNQVLKELKIKATPQLLPWSTAYALSQLPGKPTVLFPMMRTKERESLFHWVGPIATSSIVLFSHKPTSFSSLKNFSFGVIRGDIGGILLGSLGVEEHHIFDHTDFGAMLESLIHGKVHFIVYDYTAGKKIAKDYGVNLKKTKTLTRKELYFAFNKSIVKHNILEFQKAFNKVMQNQDLIKQLEETYLS